MMIVMIVSHCNDLPAAFLPPASVPCYEGLHCLLGRLPLVLVQVLVPSQVEWVVV